MPTVQLIVGLANPIKEYGDTRHNAGAWFVEKIARGANVSLRRDAKYQGLHALAQLYGHACHLLIPTRYMNLNGQTVHACMRYHKIPPASILIAHDDIDLPAGVIKLKWDGGDGGHNGLKDVIHHLATKQFYRLRIGVGHPGNSKEVVDYVLNPPPKAERNTIDEAIQKAYDVLPYILSGEMQKAMHKLHTEKNP